MDGILEYHAFVARKIATYEKMRKWVDSTNYIIYLYPRISTLIYLNYLTSLIYQFRSYSWTSCRRSGLRWQ